MNEKFTTKQIAEQKNIDIHKAKSWLEKQVKKGTWEKIKINKNVYFTKVTYKVLWHDIFNLAKRKPNGQALKDYKEARGI